MKNFKKLISVILAVMMVVSVVPVGATTGDTGNSSGTPEIPEGAILLFNEDFETGYTVGDNWVKDENKVTISGGDSVNYSFGNWDFQSNLNSQSANTGDSISVEDVSALNLGGGFSGNALKLYNNRANAYNRNYLAFRRNFTEQGGSISLTSGEYAGKKLVYEADVILHTLGSSYTSDRQSSFFVPSKSAKIYDYANGQWKPAIRADKKALRFEQGAYAGSSNGMNYMWYMQPQSAENSLTRATTIKVVLDQTGKVDTMSAWVGETPVTKAYPEVFTDHALNGTTLSGIGPAGFAGQEFNFADTIYGIWGNVSDMTIYIDNFKAYLVEEFKVSSVATSDQFDPATGTIDFTFTNKVDSATVTTDAAVLLDNSGSEITGGIEDVTLSADGYTLKVKTTETLLGVTTYKVALKDVLKDVYGYALERDYEWYEYPMTEKYTLTNNEGTYGSGKAFTYVPKTATEGAKVTAGGKTAFIDCYIPKMTAEKTTVEFTTCQMLEYEQATPANNSITDYVQGENQEIVLEFNDVLAETVDIANAFEVKDEDGEAVTGLVAEFGATKDIVKLQLSGLTLGKGKHTISSKENTLFNSANKYANITYSFDTLDFTATVSETGFDYMPQSAKTVTATLSIPTVLDETNIETGFEIKNENGEDVTGLGISLDASKKVVTFSLENLDIEEGACIIKPTSALTDNRGRTADFEIAFDIIEFTATASESSGFQLKPGEAKTVTVTLSLPTTLTADNIATGFKVETQAGAPVSGMGVSLDATGKVVTLDLSDLVVDNGKYFIKSTSALADAIGRTAEVNLMMNVAKEVILFEEDFEFGYTLSENWINNGNKVNVSDGDTNNYTVYDGRWDVQTNGAPTTDSVSVVDVAGLNLGGNFSGNALRLFNNRATSYSSGHLSVRRNFNGTTGISLTSGEYAGKKLVYEADVMVKNVGTSYTSDHQSSFMAVSRQYKIHDYGAGQWKPTIQAGGQFRVEEGVYATSSYGPLYMWYNTPASTHNYVTDAGKIKVILDQTGVVDTITVICNGQTLSSTANSVLDGHKRNGIEKTALTPAYYQGQEFNFADTIYGIWGGASDMEIYIDNFKAYLVDDFKVTSVAVDGNSASFEASTDSIVYTFTGEVDAASLNNAVEVYDAEGNKVANAVKSATLEGGNKVLRVVLAKSLAGETNYKVVLTDAITDIYGANISKEYVWYEYPIDEYYTAVDGKYTIGSVECIYIPATATKGATMKKSDGTREALVDCYIPQTSSANREAEITTARKIVVESVSPAVVPGYDLGKDQTITIKLAETLTDTVDLSTAFTVTDKDGKNITGLSAVFGDTKDTIILQLSGLALGDGKHLIESVDGALVNEEGIFANISISISTVDFMVTYAEPGSEVITEYKEGDDQTIVLGLSSPSTLAAAEFATGFEVVDETGTKIQGIQAAYNANNLERTDDDTITLQLSGLTLGKGKHTIKATDKLVDRRGRTLDYEYIFTILPFRATYEGTITGYEPKTEKAIEIALTYPLSEASAAGIANTFVVENSENLKVNGLAATVSEDRKVITLQLKGLDISGGVYKITSVAGALASESGETLSAILITVDTGSNDALDTPEGEGAGSGAPLAPGTSFATEELLFENFENSIEKAERGIEFVPSVNWYTSPEKIPSVFKLEKKGTEFRDAEVKIVPDPADPSSGNMVLMSKTGYYGKDGSVLANVVTNSNAVNYHIISREADNMVTIDENKYTEVRMSSKVYVPSSSVNYIPASSEQLRNSQYLIAATSSEGKTINGTNFAKDTSSGMPKFHMYISDKNKISTAKTGGVDKTFTADEWHTIEFVYSVNPFVNDGLEKASHHVYIDGVLVNDAAFLSADYKTIDGMMSRLASGASGAPIVVYYDDWKITKVIKYTTHIDIPQTGVPENQAITLTLTKKFDAESVKLIEDSLKDEAIEDVVTITDNYGNAVDADIVISNGDVITITPKNGLKYQSTYLLEVKTSTKIGGIEHSLKSEDGESYKGLSYEFATAKAKDTYIDTETSSSTFNCHSDRMETATRFTYTMNLSGAHGTDVIAAVAAFTEKEELIGSEYQIITSGNTQAAFDFNTFAGKTGAKFVRMYIWEAKPDGNGGYTMGRLMQLPDEITNR